jgi:predicted homoserine dehydrogenase-like protein
VAWEFRPVKDNANGKPQKRIHTNLYAMNQMKTLKARLQSLEKEVRVAVIGIGSIGKGLVYQVNSTPGMKPVAIADIFIHKAIDCAKWLKFDYEIVNSLEDLNYAIQRGKVAVTDKAELITGSGLVHVLIESSNAVLQGALHALKAIQNHQHVVMMNFEAEMMYGPVLLRAAQNEGVVYTCADGDQPTVIKRMIDDIELWGLDIVMAGNIKNFLDRYTDPLKIAPEADKRTLDHKMCSSYTDGTKLCVEMAVLANAINGRTAVPGMFGHRMTHVNEIFKYINFDEVWDGKHPLVDYVLGSEPKGGVFVVAHTADKFQQYTFNWFPPDVGPGPYYVFSRPYHLGHIEAMHCVAEAYLDGTARLQPVYGMRTNVHTFAKRTLKAGDRLDGMGGFNSYGLIENLDENTSDRGLPILLNDGLKLKRDVAKDERITLDDVEYDQHDRAFELYFQSMGKNLVAEPARINPENSNLQLA